MIGYISIKQILDDLLAHPLMRDLSLERAVDHAIHFMRIVGSPKIFIEKVSSIQINNYKGLLPCDFYKIIQVRAHCSNNTLSHATDSFHMGNHKNSIEPTYKIQGNIIHTSVEKGELEVSYLALPIDEDNYPLLPDDSYFIRALELYIKKQWFTILYDLGKITPQVLQNTQQEYAWAVGQCQSNMIKPSIDEMQAITNMWNTLVPRVNEASRGFSTSGVKEHIKRK